MRQFKTYHLFTYQMVYCSLDQFPVVVAVAAVAVAAVGVVAAAVVVAAAAAVVVDCVVVAIVAGIVAHQFPVREQCTQTLHKWTPAT